MIDVDMPVKKPHKSKAQWKKEKAAEKTSTSEESAGATLVKLFESKQSGTSAQKSPNKKVIEDELAEVRLAARSIEPGATRVQGESTPNKKAHDRKQELEALHLSPDRASVKNLAAAFQSGSASNTMEEDVEEQMEEAPQDDVDHASASEKPKSADFRSSTHATASMVVRNEDASNGGWGSIVALTAVVVLAALAIHRALKRR